MTRNLILGETAVEVVTQYTGHGEGNSILVDLVGTVTVDKIEKITLRLPTD